ncbi:MAG: glycogen debranching protein [Cyanothece sp. SIO1E1]|nr:glycogen debranching protein [Cyanothece sp. SIO1E1]
MAIQLGREICGDLHMAQQREWLVTNGIGGYACGTVAGLLTRHYHGLLIAALTPPLGRTLLFTKLDEVADYGHQTYAFHTNRWADGVVNPHGYQYLECFQLEGTIPVWTFACGDALLEKRVWMQPDANTTYVRYTLKRASEPLHLTLKAMVNYRDHHHSTVGKGWQLYLEQVEQGLCVNAFEGAVPFYLFTTHNAQVSLAGSWYTGYQLAIERYRGIADHDDHCHAATFQTTLQPGASMTLVASTEPSPNLDGEAALVTRQRYEKDLLDRWHAAEYLPTQNAPDWVEQLVLAADQFIVARPIPDVPDGKTVIAGYPWFGDWGRDTMISLPGLTMATGRPELARPILSTFARYLDQGMLPNLFPDAGATPEYNTVDAILWYFEAIRAYHAATGDDDLLQALFPALADVIDWHQRGTRYNIHLDPDDGLIYAGEVGAQLTWMDAKIGDWVVTPRIGKPIEVNALWYNALVIMVQFAQRLGQPYQPYEQLAQQAAAGFQRFWNPTTGHCYDVLDGPDGNDAALRPNQIFAVSLPTVGVYGHVSSTHHLLLRLDQQRGVVDACARSLLTSYGLRSLTPTHPQYQGHYGGDPYQRDSAYHQGPVWGWLLGPFVQAHLRVYQNPAIARSFLQPIANHLQAGCVGNCSEIFDGNVPISPRGAFAQAWTVAEVLRLWMMVAADKS